MLTEPPLLTVATRETERVRETEISRGAKQGGTVTVVAMLREIVTGSETGMVVEMKGELELTVAIEIAAGKMAGIGLTTE